MKKNIILIFCILLINRAWTQNVAINNDGSIPHASAMLDIKSTDKGLLIPRVNLLSETDITTINNPRLSLLIYNNNGTLPDGEGFYYWNGNLWTKLATRTNLYNLAWNVGGNAATNPANDFIGTTDNKPLIFKTNNILSGKIEPGPNNVFFGQSAGLNNTSGNNNSFFGHLSGTANTTGSNNLFAGQFAGTSNTTGNGNAFAGHAAGRENTMGNRNTFLGEDAGINNTSGNQNTLIGNGAGRDNTTASGLVAIGLDALSSNTTGYNNVAIGTAALKNAVNTQKQVAIGDSALYFSTGSFNTATGSKALYSSTTGFENTANGVEALYSNTTGLTNTAVGYYSMRLNTNGNANTATGKNAMYSNTAGNNNSATGYSSLYANTTGNSNSAFGYNSLYINTTGDFNTAIGESALRYNTTGSNNTAIGYDAGPQPFVPNLVNTTCIGDEARVTTSNTMVFGNGDVVHWAFGKNTTFVNAALDVGSNSTNGNGAYLTLGGTWTNTSSRKKKENFSDINGLELLQKIIQLPVQKWKYKGTGEYHIGPVAEDFYKLFGLGTDDKGISTVDPAGIALAAIQEQQRMIEKQNKLIEQLQKRIEVLEKK
jgi:trimeric autotransporter adhesin